MKLHITDKDLEAGQTLQTLSTKGYQTLQKLIESALPFVAIEKPVRHEGRIYSLIYVTAQSWSKDGTTVLFMPVWNRCFITKDSRRNRLNAIVLETETTQIQALPGSVLPSKFTTHGPGVGPEADEESQCKLAEILDSFKKDASKVQAMQWLRFHMLQLKLSREQKAA